LIERPREGSVSSPLYEDRKPSSGLKKKEPGLIDASRRVLPGGGERGRLQFKKGKEHPQTNSRKRNGSIIVLGLV